MFALLAALIEGKTDLADWLFLIGALLGAVAAVAYATLPPYKSPPAALVAGCVALTAFGLLVL